MTSVLASTKPAVASVLGEPVVTRFRDDLRGELLRPGDAGYDGARAVWNGMIDRRPAFIARCAGAVDVVRCVNFAREHGLLVAVRAGGHNVAGNAVCDDGLMIDLSPMRGIRVDPVRRTVRAEGGVIWGELDRETQAFGLATPGGFVSSTGVAGLTLGGGIAWLMGKYGLACDNLLSVDIVTADGRFLTASTTENEDLFWGVRGGGGNFGVVTSLEFRLHPVGPMVLGGLLVHPVSRAREVHRAFQEVTHVAPDELIALIALLNLPEVGPAVGIGVCYNGPIAEGERVLHDLRQFGPALADQIAPMPYTQVQTLFDPMYPRGRRTYWKSNFLSSMDAAAVDTMVEHFRNSPSSLSHSFLEGFTGAVRRVGREETAFAQRDSDYNFTLIALWTDPAEDEMHIRWGREYWQAMQPFSAGGVYVNYLGSAADEGEERVKAAYGPAKYARLAGLKKKYDPANMFRLNQNISPALET
jgi:FAD/FMN-containing dehydrogenase